ncbi:hypothetical protein ACXJJ3_18590 [Kribbella sp. WER1]
MPCVVVVVAVGAGVVVVAVVVGVLVGAVVPGGAVVGTVVGTTVGGTTVVPTVGTVVAADVGAVVGAVLTAEVGAVLLLVDGAGVEESLPGLVLDCWDGPLPGVDEPVVGCGVCTAASTAGVCWCLALAGSGSGISGVSIRGPPSRLLVMSTR